MVSEIKKYVNVRNPLFQYFIFLLIFASIATLDYLISPGSFNEKLLIPKNIALLCGLHFLFYYIVRYKLSLTTVNPFNMWITTLLVYLLIHPSNPWWMFVFIFIAIFFAKRFLKYQNRPIFNPAASGILITLYLTKLLHAIGISQESLLVSWWGADIRQNFLSPHLLLHTSIALALLIMCVYFAFSFRKLKYSSAFFLTYLICMTSYALLQRESLASMMQFITQSFIDSTIFLALVMIPEPKTSPTTPAGHIIIGIMSGALLFFSISLLHNVIAEPFTTTIIAANVITVFATHLKLFR